MDTDSHGCGGPEGDSLVANGGLMHRQICGPDGAGPSIYDQEDGVFLNSPSSIDDGSEILRSAKYAFFQKQRSLGFRRVLRIVGDQYERRFRFGAKLQEQLDDGV